MYAVHVLVWSARKSHTHELARKIEKNDKSVQLFLTRRLFPTRCSFNFTVSYSNLQQASPQSTNPLPSSSTCHNHQPIANPTGMSESSPKSATDFYLKVINPANKKEYKLYTMRNLSADVDSPDKLKNALSEE